MGVGDWLMACGEAAHRFAATGRRTLFRHPKGHVVREWPMHLVAGVAFEPGPDVDEVIEGGGVRPYIADKLPDRWVWRDYEPKPAPLRLDQDAIERRMQALASGGAPDVVFATASKLLTHRNKEWPSEHWVGLAKAAWRAGMRCLQIVPSAGAHLRHVDLSQWGARTVAVSSFEDLCVTLAAANRLNAVLVTHEGGTHHAAAAVGMRAIVLFGGFISPKQTGYGFHRNLFAGGKPCGSRVDCTHCAEAMRSIEPIDVLADAFVAAQNPRAPVPPWRDR